MDEIKNLQSSYEIISFNNLRPHQKKAVNIATDLLTGGKKKVLLELATGTGKTAIITELTKHLIERGIIHNALILTDNRMISEQIAANFYKETPYSVTGTLNTVNISQIVVLTYSQFRTIATIDSAQKFDLIVCNEAQYTNNKDIKYIFKNLNTLFVGIISRPFPKKQALGWFSDEQTDFCYSAKDSINNSYAYPPIRPLEYSQSLEDFCSRLLDKYGYNVIMDRNLSSGSALIRPDILIFSGEQQIALEIKAYRGRYVNKSVIDIAIEQILKYKNVLEVSESPKVYHYTYCLVLFCEIDTKQKEHLFKQHEITVWDISNLLYICSDYPELIRELSEILYFPISDITPEKPFGWMPHRSVMAPETLEISTQSTVESLEERLHACKVGKEKKAAAEYERICTEIIQFLFDGEFTQSFNQHKTEDDLFRMDLLCGIKGSSAFWELLTRHYNTRFVVFEYKNYSTLLPQNLIYTTEKYLFNAALRNVAIMLSRKGFSKNARSAALGCLKESGKLIIDFNR